MEWGQLFIEVNYLFDLVFDVICYFSATKQVKKSILERLHIQIPRSQQLIRKPSLPPKLTDTITLTAEAILQNMPGDGEAACFQCVVCRTVPASKAWVQASPTVTRPICREISRYPPCRPRVYYGRFAVGYACCVSYHIVVAHNFTYNVMSGNWW